jgi:hypothetical protein
MDKGYNVNNSVEKKWFLGGEHIEKGCNFRNSIQIMIKPIQLEF